MLLWNWYIVDNFYRMNIYTISTRFYVCIVVLLAREVWLKWQPYICKHVVDISFDFLLLHKIYLCFSCSSDFKEKDTQEIALPDKKAEDVITLMMMLHPPSIDLNSKYWYSLLLYIKDWYLNHTYETDKQSFLSQFSSFT